MKQEHKYKTGKLIAEGGQKKVYIATHSNVGTVIKKGDISSFVSLERMRREIEFLSNVNSKYYPKQFDFNIDVKKKEITIVEEHIQGLTLRKYAKKLQKMKKQF